MNHSQFDIAAAIAANNEDEQEAIKGYYELLKVVVDPVDQEVIKEIIADEKNHSALLTKLAMKYDGAIQMAEDGLDTDKTAQEVSMKRAEAEAEQAQIKVADPAQESKPAPAPIEFSDEITSALPELQQYL
jgi:hypothetical protein